MRFTSLLTKLRVSERATFRGKLRLKIIGHREQCLCLDGNETKIEIKWEKLPPFVTLHGISRNEVNALTRHARTLKQKN